MSAENEFLKGEHWRTVFRRRAFEAKLRASQRQAALQLAAIVALAIAAGLLVISWEIILPVIGLLYLFGWLK